MILITISSDHDFHSDVAAAFAGKLRFEATWSFDYSETGRVHGATAEKDCLAIIDFADSDRALTVARSVAGRPRLTAIAVGCRNGAEELLRLMQAGIRDVIPQFSPREILQAATRATSVPGRSAEVLADLYAFVPAKPGCGATTVATYATAMAADMAGEPTLLLDFDLRLGVTTFLLKAEGTCSLADALNHVHRLDRDVWGGIVSQIGNLHLLGSGPVDLGQPFAAEQFIALLDFVVRQYSVVGVDLPGTMEDHECAALLRAKKILLVCTSEVGALHLARRRAKWFDDLRVSDKVAVVLNCTGRGNSLSVGDVERVIGLPVEYMLPMDVKEISKAVQQGTVLQDSSALGKQLAKIAGAMVPAQRSNKYPTALRRFVEYFSVSPARDAKTGRRA